MKSTAVTGSFAGTSIVTHPRRQSPGKILGSAESARLLEAIAGTDRAWDAVVIGEPQRAFYGDQFTQTFPVLIHYGVSLWVPGIGGRVDPGSEAHDLVTMLFGGMSKGERNRVKVRVRFAMAQQATQGRFLGGRPPYGYGLADHGPHPNPSKAGGELRGEAELYNSLGLELTFDAGRKLVNVEAAPVYSGSCRRGDCPRLHTGAQGTDQRCSIGGSGQGIGLP